MKKIIAASLVSFFDASESYAAAKNNDYNEVVDTEKDWSIGGFNDD